MKKYLFLLAFILPFMAMGQLHPTNITFDSKGRFDSVYYEKDSTVKGYIFYLKKYPAYRQYPSMIRTYLMEGHPAAAHYQASSAFRVINPDGTQSWQANWKLYKIEVDHKPFDLNKYYQFIPENQVVE